MVVEASRAVVGAVVEAAEAETDLQVWPTLTRRADPFLLQHTCVKLRIPPLHEMHDVFSYDDQLCRSWARRPTDPDDLRTTIDH